MLHWLFLVISKGKKKLSHGWNQERNKCTIDTRGMIEAQLARDRAGASLHKTVTRALWTRNVRRSNSLQNNARQAHSCARVKISAGLRERRAWAVSNADCFRPPISALAASVAFGSRTAERRGWVYSLFRAKLVAATGRGDGFRWSVCERWTTVVLLLPKSRLTCTQKKSDEES
jgi:hypothetical protein